MQSEALSPWRLRIEHHGFSHLELDTEAGRIHFMPGPDWLLLECSPDEQLHTVILLWCWSEMLSATAEAISLGHRLRVIAPAPILEWLRPIGSFEGVSSFNHAAAEPGGARVDVDLIPYLPMPERTSMESLRLARSVLRNPFRALRRRMIKRGFPICEPMCAELTFPSGARLVHLNLACHSSTSARWWSDMVKRCTEAEWIIVGCDYEHADAVERLLADLKGTQILLTDLVGDYRRRAGLPVRLLTPLVDRLTNSGHKCFVFATKASYRYDRIALL